MQDEVLMEIRVKCRQPASVTGKKRTIVMIPFEGEASGAYFSGRVIGTGVDTQQTGPDGKTVLSARYMLEGSDAAGNACRIFVENRGSRETGFTPEIVTDSPLLAGWENAELRATVDGIPEGVIVRIYQKAASPK